MIFQTIIWSNRTHSLKYQRYTALESKDIGIRKSEFVIKTQFLYENLLFKFLRKKCAYAWYNVNLHIVSLNKGIESLPQTLIFQYLYMFNPMTKTLDISNYELC